MARIFLSSKDFEVTAAGEWYRDTVYRGYVLRQEENGMWAVFNHGYAIQMSPTIEEAKLFIDKLYPPRRNQM